MIHLISRYGLPMGQKIMKQKKLKEYQSDPQTNNREIGKRLYKLFNDQLGVFCMSQSNDNIVLYSYYSDGHKGFCLELNWSADEVLRDFCYPVKYKRRYPAVNYFGSKEKKGGFELFEVL